MQTHVHGLVQLDLHSRREYANSLWDCEVIGVFDAPSGRRLEIRAFWDGGRLWRLRFSPDETGLWRWHTRCSLPDDDGLHGAAGCLECLPYAGDNPLYRHGPLRLSGSRRFLCHADGTPFFWLGDTAWNGVIRGDDANWQRYLELRRAQRFSLIQFVASHWRGDAVDETGEASCSEEHPIHVNPGYFQRLDRRIAMVNDAGLVAAPVALWSLLKTDIGRKLDEPDAIRIAAYIVARYDAHQVVWLLGGDGNYQEMGVERWRRLGREVFRCGHGRLVTLHPCGQNWIGEEFRGEPWYHLIGYQSGHGDGDGHLRWLVHGPPARQWASSPALPVINLEPNYEMAFGYQHKTVFNDFHVRRAAYWSLLASPTAGLTYGHDAIWNWNFETGPSEGHGNWRDRSVPPWHTGLETPGIRSMTVLRRIFDHLDWTTLVPCPEVLEEPSADADVSTTAVAARNSAGTVVCYSPVGGDLRFRAEAALPTSFRRVDPRSGEWLPPEALAGRTLRLPAGADWLAVLTV